MATVQVTFKPAMQQGVPVEAAGFSSNQTFTSSATSQAALGTARNSDVMVINTDVNIRFAVGESPTAAADDTSELLNAGRYQLSIAPGHKCAIIDA